ncbi:hypothetical protein [Actinocrinis sp.]|uniref:hypothetical protein n=1 Tax=Actinocrinis sp. TaxID=1920516 RepID=UPI002DDD7063|nr:hypothetical protein [Actinocrinis sp.]
MEAKRDRPRRLYLRLCRITARPGCVSGLLARLLWVRLRVRLAGLLARLYIPGRCRRAGRRLVRAVLRWRILRILADRRRHQWPWRRLLLLLRRRCL